MSAAQSPGPRLAPGASHSSSFDHRLRPETFLTAIATAFFWPHQHDQPLPAGHAGVEQVPLQHCVGLGHHGNDHGGVFRSLALVNGSRIGLTGILLMSPSRATTNLNLPRTLCHRPIRRGSSTSSASPVSP